MTSGSGFSSWGGETFVDGLAGEELLSETTQAQRVERLHEPTISLGVMAKEHVGGPVEKQRHGAVFEAVETSFLLEREAGGNAAHVADLEVEQHQGRVEFCNGRQDMASGSDAVDLDVVAGQCGVDFVEDGVGVGGKKDSVHIGERSPQIGPRGTWVTDKR